MARSLASCLFLLTLCSSLLLHSAFARKASKHVFEETSSDSPTTAPSPAPSSEADSPSSEEEAPSSEVEGPSSDVEEPSSEVDGPSSKAEGPSSKAEGSSSKAEGPSSKAEGPSSEAEAPSSEAEAPVAGSLGMIVASQKGKSFTKHICELSSKPPVCSKILSGKDQKFMASLPRGTAAMLSIELSAAVASKASLYMTDKMSSHVDHPALTSILNGCIENYKEAIGGFKSAYMNFTPNPATASKSLSVADAKIGSCEASLIKGVQDSNLSRIDETNKLLRGLVQLVSKEMTQ